MTYTIQLPNAWTDPKVGYRARIKHSDGTGATLRLYPGRVHEVPSEIKNSSTFWIESFSLGSDEILETISPGRVRFEALKFLVKLPELAYTDSNNVSSQLFEKLFQAIQLSRYLCRSDITSRMKRFAHRLGHFSSRLLKFEDTVLGKIATRILNDDVYAEDDLVKGQIIYLYWVDRLKKVITPTHFHQRDEDLRAPLDKPALESILKELAAHSALATLKPMVVAINDLLGHYDEASEVAKSLSPHQGARIVDSYMDMGVFTYTAQFPVPINQELTWRWARQDTAEGTDNRPVILCSVDERFLGLYGPRWLYNAQFFPEVRWHIHLVSDNQQSAQQVIDMLDTISEKNSALSGLQRPHLNYSISDVPRWVGNPITYYACARFLIVRDLMNHYSSPVWVQDIDLQPLGDFMKDYDKFLDYDVLAVRSPQLGGAFPWKRYLAGNVFINNTAKATNWIESIEKYMYYFLPQKKYMDARSDRVELRL